MRHTFRSNPVYAYPDHQPEVPPTRQAFWSALLAPLVVAIMEGGGKDATPEVVEAFGVLMRHAREDIDRHSAD